ncbi:MAG: S1 RNA-binding domain-containing protein, partial [Candidatus Dadabacteria bacterium]
LLEERYPVGAVVRGQIRNITDFGIFVGVDEGIDGLIHVSDISWTKRVGHPATLYKVGDEVEAVVLHIDKENERFSLGIKQLTPDPWAGITARYRVGSIVTGKVSNITDFGVFVELEPGVEGLVHVSEVSSEKVDDLKSLLEVGQEIQAEVLNIDQEERKISLSMKAIEDEQVRAEKMALDQLNKEMAAQSATTLGEKILLAKQAKEAQANGESEAAEE